MIVRKIREEELKRCYEVMSIAFEFPNKETRSNEEIVKEANEQPKTRAQEYWREKWAAFEDDDHTMMGMMFTIPYTVQFDGGAYPMCGIGGVSTLPQYRKNGVIRGCFEHNLPQMYEDGVLFSYLYPFSTAFYRKFGYEMCGERVLYEIDLRAYSHFPVEGKAVLAEGQSLNDAIASVYRDFCGNMNLMCVRKPYDFPGADGQNPAKDCVYTYVYFAKDGTPKGVMTFTKEQLEPYVFEMRCSQFYFSDWEGFYGLLNHALAYKTYYKKISFWLPSHFDVVSRIPEWAKVPCKRTCAHTGMNRVINVEAVLKAARYQGSGSVSIGVCDDQIQKNNGVFLVVFENGQAVTVEKTDSAPDITMSICDFSRLITGTHQAEDALTLPGVSVCNPSAPFAAVFYKKPIFIMDSF